MLAAVMLAAVVFAEGRRGKLSPATSVLLLALVTLATIATLLHMLARVMR